MMSRKYYMISDVQFSGFVFVDESHIAPRQLRSYISSRGVLYTTTPTSRPAVP